MSNLEIAVQYSNDCINNIIPSCSYIKKACQRFLNDIEDDSKYFYDSDDVDTLIDFCQSFYLTEVQPPTLTILRPWQIWILANLWGIKNKETFKKKYRLANISVARGNAKTQLVALLCIYELIYGYDAQIILAGNTTKTTMEVDYDKIKKLVHQIDPDQKHIKVLYNKMTYEGNKIICTSNESKPFDGMSGSLMLLDEAHLFLKNNIYGTMRSSMIKRTDNILFIISTSGFSTDTEYYKLCEYSKKVLDGDINDDTLFAALYYVDDEDIDTERIYTSEDCIIKANPNFGVSVQRDVITTELQTAKQNESERVSILTKHLNIWANKTSLDAYVLDKYLQESFQDMSLDDEQFKGCDVLIGCDLSINNDISAVSYLIMKDDLYYYFVDYYICSEALTTKKNRERYKECADKGLIKIINGRAIDYEVIINDIKARNYKNPVKLIGYDKYNATDFVKRLDSEGFNLVTISQLGSGLNGALKELQRLFLLKKVRLQRNEITSWMFSNVVIKQGITGLIMIDKSNSESNKIDGVSAMVDSLAGFLIAPNYGFNIF
jgi:phage terminase large subunit-like protein